MSRWIWRMVTGLVLAALATVPVRGLASVDGASAATVDRRIAITFDDLPWVMLRNEPPANLAAEHARLIASLKQESVPVIGFVNEGLLYEGDTLRPERIRMLDDWLDAGFELGNHTRWHSDLNAVGVKAFERDILDGEHLLRPLLDMHGLKLQWFRYPELRTGTTLEDKAAVEAFLAEHGYRNAPVTINSSEWVFALAYRRAIAANAPEQTLQHLRDDYVAYMQAKLQYYEGRSVALLGYEVPQVLLLHASELNADTCTVLFSAMRARGYRFVSLAQATSDPAYQHADTYVGAFGTSWIHRWARTEGRPDTFFYGEPRTPQWIIDLAGVPAGFE
jgi:peptidoglycan/xylan/chitin deacetylase (PgdA/CDA1 family)